MDRWKSFRDFGNMREAVDRWLDDRFNNTWQTPNAQVNALSVAVDVHEISTGYELTASLPGIKPENVDIQVDGETITLRGTTVSDDTEETDRNYIYRERRIGNFFRSVTLPEAIDADRVEATLDHGILKVELPRLAGTQNRRVEVRSAARQGSQPAGSQPVNLQLQTSPAGTAPEQEAIAANSDNDGGPV